MRFRTMRSLTGTKSSTSLQRKKAESLIIDGERMSVMSMLILPLKVLNVQQQIRSLSVQQQQQQQQWCTVYPGRQRAHGKVVVPPSQNIKSSGLQFHRSMWSFRIQDTRSRQTYGTLMYRWVFAIQAPLHLSFVIATPWIVHTFQVMAEVAHSQQMTSAILIVMPLWKTWRNFRSIARSSSSKPCVVVYGLKGFRTTSWMSKRKSRRGFQAWQMSSSGWRESNLRGSINCRLKVVHQPLRHPWEHLPFSSTSHVIQCSFYYHNQASSDVKECIHGICAPERSISTRNGCWSMGWHNEKKAAPVIGIDDAKTAARSEWKGAIRPAKWLLETS